MVLLVYNTLYYIHTIVMDDGNSHSIRTFCKLIAKVEKIFATFKFHFVLLSQHQFAKKINK